MTRRAPRIVEGTVAVPPPVGEIYVASSRSYGSGILIAPGLLLGASHILGEADRCEVRLHTGDAETAWRSAKPVWRSHSDDVVLLGPAGRGRFASPGSFTLVRFGRRPLRATDCRLIGFPAATDLPKRGFNDSLEAEGRIQPRTFRGEGRLAVSVVSATPLEPRRWRGMSGAGILCGRTLLGIVLETAPEFGATMLKGLPIENLLDQPGWVDVVAAARRTFDLDEATDASADLDSSGAIDFEPALRACIERRLGTCITQHLPFRTHHKLKCAFEARSGFAQACFAQAGTGIARRIEDWLDQSNMEQARHDRGAPPLPNTLETDSTFVAARSLAAAEGASKADERHLLLALFNELRTTTMATLGGWLGKERTRRVASFARSHRPRRLALSATPLTPSTPLPPLARTS